MDRYVTRGELPLAGPSPLRQKSSIARNFTAYELNGRLTCQGQYTLRNQFLDSFVELGSVPQSNISRCFPPPPGAASWLSVDEDNLITFGEIMVRGPGRNYYSQRPYISGIEFDKKGVYVASVSCGGCLSIHDFDKLRARASGLTVADVKPDVYIPTRQRLEAIRWNPENQDELACVAAATSSIITYDLERNASMPSEVLVLKKGAVSAGNRGLYDLAYACSGRNRMLACGRDGCVYMWDRRVSLANVSSMTASSPLNSLQLSADEQLVCAGSEGGGIHVWDIRGGREQQTFGSRGEVHHPPLAFVSVASLLRSVKSLQEQTDITASPVLSIAFDPSDQRRIAFYLNNGWSGVVDLTTEVVTHAHCPPPPWLATSGNWSSAWSHVRRRKPAWLTTHSVYCVGPAVEPALVFLDFSAKSMLSMDNYERRLRELLVGSSDSSKRSVKLTECAVAMAVHPLSNEIVVGSKEGSLLVVGQPCRSTSADCSSEEGPSTSYAFNHREGGVTGMGRARLQSERISRFFRSEDAEAMDGGSSPRIKRIRVAERGAAAGDQM